MAKKLTLISHHLCPYVQRAAICLAEKNTTYKRVTIDLAQKPDWFLKLSPLGKVPVLLINDTAIFESAVILEFLEETQSPPLHPKDAVHKACHRSWIEYASATLSDIAGLYNAPDQHKFAEKITNLTEKFRKMEEVVNSPWFDGSQFSLVDAAFAPVFRYFDAFDSIADFGIFDDVPKISAWRQHLSSRPSVQTAVSSDYPERLKAFLAARESHLGSLLKNSTWN